MSLTPSPMDQRGASASGKLSIGHFHDARGVAVASWDANGTFTEGNQAFLSLLGLNATTLELRHTTWESLVVPSSARTQEIMRSLLDVAGMTPPFETVWQRTDGAEVPVLIVSASFERMSGCGWLFALDQREQQDSQAAITASEERYRLVTRAAGGVLWEWDPQEDSIALGTGTFERFGWDIDDVPVPLSWFHQRIHEEDVGAMLARAEEVLTAGTTSATHAYRFRRANGQWAMVHDHFHVIRDETGQAKRVIGVMLDASERHALQEQLRQAQKMEAVGRLAGGIAHDFNNLLTVIRGNASLAMEGVESTNPLFAELTNIEQAAARATDLTRQLLAFSRKQVLIPQPLDINAVVAQLTRLLDRLMPSSIATRLTPAAETGLIKTDRSQLEQVILNLVINARDAMPNGGMLEVRTGEFSVGEGAGDFMPPDDVPIRPGKYVHLAVADSGTGMDANTRAHAFEPFFTTKSVGLGTGLGLATVYGIVKQSDGYVWIDSALGKGTTVNVALPRFEGQARRPRPTPTSTAVIKETHTVLLVEDEPGVRELAVRVLRRAGYRVLVAGDGLEALALWEDNPAQVDVVVTDVVMPRLGGSELVTRLRGERNDVPVLFMSGYARNAAIGDAPADRRTRFLQKPFTVPALQHAVSELVLMT
ncbi:MAG: response regulator [Phycisphaerae bacterium]|nr:response regulator [Gemmatimonadaceae bacterium]